MLVAYKGNPKGRDWLNSDFLSAGRKLCGAKIIQELKYASNQRHFQGRFYDPSNGANYQLILTPAGKEQLKARVYMGTDTGEIVDVALSIALGGGLGVFEGASLITRASIGKEHLSDLDVWHRVDVVPNACTQ